MTESTPPPTYWQFLRAFRKHWIIEMSGAVSVAASILAAFVPGVRNAILVGASALFCAFLASYAVWKHERVSRIKAEHNLDLERDGETVGPHEWSVDFSGSVADIKILSDELTRYGVAVNVVITNRSAKPISASAALHIEWGHPMFYKVAAPRELAIAEWDSLLAAFDLPRKRQLLFPFTLSGGSSSGHIAFDIPIVGIGVTSLAEDYIGGLKEDDETERARTYILVVKDDISGVEKQLNVSTLYAPSLDGSHISNYTDLAVAGRAATLVLPSTA